MRMFDDALLLTCALTFIVYIGIAYDCKKSADRCHKNYLKHDRCVEFKGMRNEFYVLAIRCLSVAAMAAAVLFHLIN